MQLTATSCNQPCNCMQPIACGCGCGCIDVQKYLDWSWSSCAQKGKKNGPDWTLKHYSSLWSPQHFWCITLPSPQTMDILCLRDSLSPSSQALSGTSHPFLLHQFHLFSVSTFFFSACHQECSLVVSDLLSGLKGLIWSSLCLLSILPMVPSSQTPARSIFPSCSSHFPGCDSSSIHILLISLQMIFMNVTVLISPL